MKTDRTIRIDFAEGASDDFRDAVRVTVKSLLYDYDGTELSVALRAAELCKAVVSQNTVNGNETYFTFHYVGC